MSRQKIPIWEKMLKSSFGKQFTRKEKKKKNYKQLIPNVIKSSAVAAVWADCMW